MPGQLFHVLAVAVLFAGTVQTDSTHQPKQTFYCNTGYTQPACDAQAGQLRAVLACRETDEAKTIAHADHLRAFTTNVARCFELC